MALPGPHRPHRFAGAFAGSGSGRRCGRLGSRAGSRAGAAGSRLGSTTIVRYGSLNLVNSITSIDSGVSTVPSPGGGGRLLRRHRAGSLCRSWWTWPLYGRRQAAPPANRHPSV